MTERRWPLPGDRAIDRARQVAMTALAELRDENPTRAAAFVKAARQVGEHWITGEQLYDDDDLVTPLQAADELGRAVRTVYGWVSNGRLTNVPDQRGQTRIRMGDARAVDAGRSASA